MYQLVTDGCFKYNIGGWAYSIDGTIKSGYEWGRGANQMELMAVIKGLESLSYPSIVTVFTDSNYVIIRAKRLKRNSEELVVRLHELLRYHNVTFIKTATSRNAVHHKAREAMFYAIHLRDLSSR